MFLKSIVSLIVFLSAFASWAGTPHAIYRSSNKKGDRLYSPSQAEGPNSGYIDEGIAFYLFPSNEPGTRPLFRCTLLMNGNHFLSLDPNCEGQRVEGSIGNMAMQDGPGVATLARFHHPEIGHIGVLVGRPENLLGYRLDGVLGYVVPPPGFTKPPAPTVVNDGKKYFSFYAGAMDGVKKDNDGSANGNYISELAQRSNVIFVQTSLANLDQKLTEVAQYGKKAIVSVAPYFIDGRQLLQDNYAQNFDTNVAPILRRHLSNIVAFYGFDEPYHNGLNAGRTPEEIYETQENMGRHVKSRFPNTPIAVILTVRELRDNYRLFSSFDWYGFDCYSAKMTCDKVSVWWAYDHLASRLDNMYQQDGIYRWMMSVPQAGHPVKRKSGGKDDIFDQLPHYRKIVKENPRIKMVMPFLWQSFNDGRDNWTGAREIPEVRDAYYKFYLDFMNGNL